MLRKAIGVALFFVGLGLWAIVYVTVFCWAVPVIVLAYIAGYLSHAREWPELKHFALWQWLRQRYFCFRVVGELPHPNEGPFLYAIYPHGHFAITPLVYFALNPRFGDAKAAVHSALFWIPVFGTLVRWIGAIGVSREAMLRELSCGRSIYMTPGGLADIARTGLDVRERSGFLEVARAARARVVPIWCPQERSYYDQWLPLGRALEGLFYFPVPLLLWGAWWFPFLPKGAADSPIIVGTALDPQREDFWEEFRRLQMSNSKDKSNTRAQ